MDWLLLAEDPSFTKVTALVIIWAVLFAAWRSVGVSMLHGGLTRALEKTGRSSREKKQRVETIVSVISAIVMVGIAVPVILVGFAAMGFNIGPLLASAGVVGFAIGFGSQSLVKDVINGLFILIEDQFGLDDVVEINGVKGKVVEFNLRRTVLRDEDGVAHHLPNSQIGRVANFTQDWARVNITIGVGYQEDVDKVMELLDQVGEKLMKSKKEGGFIKSEPEVHAMEELSGGVMKFKLIFKVEANKQWHIKRAALAEIKRVFDKEGVQLK